MKQTLDDILRAYGTLLREVDLWFNCCQTALPDQIRCGQGCSGCCRALFDITLLDAWQLQRGFQLLPPATQAEIQGKASQRLAAMRRQWPEFAAPYLLNYRPEADWEQLMPDEDETPCVFLDDVGRCLVYDHRPMTCRLHGMPLVDLNGEVMYDEWCTENFPDADPLDLPQLRAPFDAMFRQEVTLLQQLTQQLFGHGLGELDTFIPLAALVDYEEFAWSSWWDEVVLVENAPVD